MEKTSIRPELSTTEILKQVERGELSSRDALIALYEVYKRTESKPPQVVFVGSTDPEDPRRPLVFWDEMQNERVVLNPNAISGSANPFYAAARGQLLTAQEYPTRRIAAWDSGTERFAATGRAIADIEARDAKTYVIAYTTDGFLQDPATGRLIASGSKEDLTKLGSLKIRLADLPDGLIYEDPTLQPA